MLRFPLFVVYTIIIMEPTLVLDGRSLLSSATSNLATSTWLLVLGLINYNKQEKKTVNARLR